MVELNFKEYGSGNNNLIILHGFLGSLDNWHTLANEWGNNGLHVFALDQRNHGRSPHTDEHSIDGMVEDLKDFMTQHSISSAVILGHSMGGKVAMQFALAYPELTTKLIVADMAPRAYKPGAHDDVFNAINNVDLNKVELRKEVDEAMSQYLGDPGTRQFVMKSLDRIDEGKYKWKFNSPVLERDYNSIIAEITSDHSFDNPTMFIKGGNSLYVQDKDLPLIEKLFSNYRVETLDGAGHWLHADKPKEFFSAVLSFINS